MSSKYYVYCLIDPRDNTAFYIGKGCHDRVKHHVRDAKAGRISNAPKHNKIISILNKGLEVIELVLSENLTETEAYRLEKSMIDESKAETLTNIVGGAVSNVDKAHAQAIEAIKRIKSYDEWIATSSADRIQAAINQSPDGTAKGFRDQVLSRLHRILEKTSIEGDYAQI